MVAVRKPRGPALPDVMTVEEFLDWEGDGAGTRYELDHGALRAMAPASELHGSIQANLAHRLLDHLDTKGSACRVVTEAPVSPRILGDTNLFVPDAVVTCAPTSPDRRIVKDPILIVEILSPSNEKDTRSNVWGYSTILSVKEILLLYSDRIGAEVYRRGADGLWPYGPETVEAGGTLLLECIGFAVPITDLYARTHLAQSA